MYADVVAGGQARTRTLPQLSVTVDLTLDILDPEAPQRSVPELFLHSRILRGGKRLIFTETTVSTPQGTLLAVCTGCFSAISRTLNALGDGPVERVPRYERSLLTVPLVDRVGLEVPSPGTAEIARRSDLGNSTDSLMGGLHALLGEVAAVSRVEAESAAPHFVNGLQVRYLAPVRVGPARATVEVLGGPPSRRIARVGIRDASAPQELAADVTASCVPFG
jgi:acyl-coenzyme A thioesterase PaaI-like protein